MERARQFDTYIDFLHDEDFIRWILTRDDTLALYWKDFVDRHPECTDSFNQAVERSGSIRMNKVQLSEEEHEHLRHRIHGSLYTLRQKRRLRRRKAWYGAAMCIVLIIGAVFYLYRTSDRVDLIHKEERAAIVWQALHAEDIRLVSGDNTTLFGQDACVLLSRDGSAVVFQANNEDEKITIEQDEMNKLVVPYGKRSRVKLEDGTEIRLNSGSVLTFPTHFSGDMREVSLSGEMYVEVAEDKERPFVVHTDYFDIRVYGTKFNVSAYDGGEDIIPSCVLVEGSVGLLPKSGTEISMEPNDKVACSGQQFVKRQVRTSKYISWKDDYLELDDADIVEVLNRIGRYYNLAFDFGDKTRLTGKKCSGKIYLSDNVDNVLTTISLLYSTDYRKDKRTIFMSDSPSSF